MRISDWSSDVCSSDLLIEDTNMLEELVVVGYGTQTKKLITGATVQVKGEDLQRLSTPSVIGALQSQSPGVQITQSSGMPGEGFKVTIRGLGTIGNSRSEEHTSELQSLMRHSYAVFCFKKQTQQKNLNQTTPSDTTDKTKKQQNLKLINIPPTHNHNLRNITNKTNKARTSRTYKYETGENTKKQQSNKTSITYME